MMKSYLIIKIVREFPGVVRWVYIDSCFICFYQTEPLRQDRLQKWPNKPFEAPDLAIWGSVSENDINLLNLTIELAIFKIQKRLGHY